MVQTYQPLYLKYRPQSLADLVGQKSVAQTLTNAIEHNRISHAYLFTGPRGTGKTSSARILAKSLNCEAGPTATPCLTCSSCIEIKAGNSPSVFELDAASNNSVDDARSLIERAPLVAQGGRYKLYIIDECHMLTKEAFNALLKTIEEPPPMVVFILATTEEHKVPPTIISRCQRLMFKLVNQKELTGHLRHISTLEDLNILDESLELIARRSGGGLRDALGLLDQASLLSTKEKAVGVNDLLVLLGAVHEDVLLQISEAVQNRDGQAVLTAANTLLMEGREPAVLVLELAKHFLNLTKASYVNETGSLTADTLTSLVLGSPAYLQALVAQAKHFDRAELALMVEYLDKLEQTCRRSSQPVLNVEMGLLALCHRHDMTLVRDLDVRLKTLEGVMGDEIARGPAPSAAARPVAVPLKSSNGPADARPSETRSPDARSMDSKPMDSRPTDSRLADSRPTDSRPTDSRPADLRPTDSRPADLSSTNSRPADTMPTSGGRPGNKPTSEAPTPKAVPAKTEKTDLGSSPAKSPAPTSGFASKINEAMAAAGLGGPSTSAFKSSGAASGKTAGSAFPPPTQKVPLEPPPGDMSYDDVEPDPLPHRASPAVQPPVLEPTLEALEAQGDVVEEIDDYEIVPRPPQVSPSNPLPLAAPPASSVDDEEEEDEEQQPEPPLEADDDDEGIPPPPLVIEPPSEAPSVAVPTASVDIDELWSDVRDALAKRHLPTSSIVNVHAFPVSFEGSDFVIGVRVETFQKQLENKIEHLKAACSQVTGRAINVRVKVLSDNTPKASVGAAKSAARPKETRSSSSESEESESRPQLSPRPGLSPQSGNFTDRTTPDRTTSDRTTPDRTAPDRSTPDRTAPSAVRTTHMSEIEHRVGGNLINEAYKLFEGPGSRLIG